MKIGFITTVLNESDTITSFLDSLKSQTKKADEVVIVDGGSSDNTLELIKKHEIGKTLKIKIFVKKGNISAGRNFAIKKISADIVAISDAGCILDKNWLEKITKPFKDSSIDVVAGYYKGLYKNNFEKNLIPYVLVMPDKANKDFLPASRSMAIKKSVFEKIGGFSEKLDQAEDYDLALRLSSSGVKIKFEKNAIVSWIPRKNILQAAKMFYKYSYGDIKAGILRRKVLFIFARYLLFIFTILAARFVSVGFSAALFLTYFSLYSSWAVVKNYKYINNPSAFFYLPLLQYTSDLTIIFGSAISFIKKILNLLITFIKREKITSFSIFIFILIVLSVINWGLPNSAHPFTYHMDEWHQLQSVRNLFTFFSPNMEGSANGPIFHFALSGFYVGILTLLGFVNPFVIYSSFTNLPVQNALFIYLRLSTLFFALGSVFLLVYILKKQLKVSFIILPVVLFLFSPIWLNLSNYFKYDIALIFWITFSIFTIFRFRDQSTLKNYLIAVIPVTLAISTKISALPLLLIYCLSYFIFKKNIFKNLKYIGFGLALFILIFSFVGIPDLFLGTGNYYEYFYSNLVSTPSETYNYVLKSPYWIYLFTNQIPTLFGFVLLIIFALSILYFIYELLKTISKRAYINKSEIFILLSFLIFALSLVPLKLFIINRSLVVLPFAILFIGVIFQRFITKNWRNSKLIYLFIFIALIIHVFQGFSWIITKYTDPRQTSSSWIEKNINSSSLIGIENVPIYQFLPDIALYEYYLAKENIYEKTKYKYEIISSSTKNLPKYIIISNSDIDEKYLYKSSKKDLLMKMKKENYILIKDFSVERGFNNLFTSRLDFFISLLSPTPNIYIYERR